LPNPWTAWLAAASLGSEAQWVITLRIILLGAGGGAALRETQRMIYEKILANAQAQFAAGMALAAGRGIEGAARAAARPYKRAIGANRRRLTRGHRRSA
jgi:TPR repeat protein